MYINIYKYIICIYLFFNKKKHKNKYKNSILFVIFYVYTKQELIEMFTYQCKFNDCLDPEVSTILMCGLFSLLCWMP